MKSILGIDIETYSPVPLPKTGVYRYVDTDEFEILLFSYVCHGVASSLTPYYKHYPEQCQRKLEQYHVPAHYSIKMDLREKMGGNERE